VTKINREEERLALSSLIENIVAPKVMNDLTGYRLEEQDYAVIEKAKNNVKLTFDYIVGCLQELPDSEDNCLIFSALKYLIIDVQKLGKYVKRTASEYKRDEKTRELYLTIGEQRGRSDLARKAGIKRGKVKTQEAKKNWKTDLIKYADIRYTSKPETTHAEIIKGFRKINSSRNLTIPVENTTLYFALKYWKYEKNSGF
jgi:hypothetical protein